MYLPTPRFWEKYFRVVVRCIYREYDWNSILIDLDGSGSRNLFESQSNGPISVQFA